MEKRHGNAVSPQPGTGMGTAGKANGLIIGNVIERVESYNH
jgi:hypothetical protein